MFQWNIFIYRNLVDFKNLSAFFIIRKYSVSVFPTLKRFFLLTTAEHVKKKVLSKSENVITLSHFTP